MIELLVYIFLIFIALIAVYYAVVVFIGLAGKIIVWFERWDKRG